MARRTSPSDVTPADQRDSPHHVVLQNRLTRLGFHFAFVGAFAMLGGAIRGFNLLLVLAAMMVAAMMTQWRWCKRSTEALSIRRRLPREAFAEKTFRVSFLLINGNRFLPVWMLRVEDTIERISDKINGARFKSLASDESAALSFHGIAHTGVGVVAGRQTVFPSYQCVITRRGSYQFGPTIVSTTFPFSLMRSQMTVTDQQTLDVYPKLLQLQRGWKKRLLSRDGGANVNVNRSGRNGGEFFGLREYQAGDNTKWIHWRTTARLGKLAVRQFEQQQRFDVCVLLDAFTASDSISTADSGDELVETAFSLAATLLIDLAAIPGNRIVLALAGQQATAVVGGSSYEGRRCVFQVLSRAVPANETPLADALSKAVKVVGVPQDLVVVSPRSQQVAIDGQPGLKETMRRWSRDGKVAWLDVSSPEINQLIIGDRIESSSMVRQMR